MSENSFRAGKSLGNRCPLGPVLQHHQLAFDADDRRSSPQLVEKGVRRLRPVLRQLLETARDHRRERGRQIREKLTGGDLLVFYAGLRDVGDGRLVYALIGLLTVGRILAARDLPPRRWAENAHTRRLEIGETDIVVLGRADASGRFERALEFAGYRAGAYRVFPELLGRWGGLGVRDGYVQRSARLPEIGDPARFLDWLAAQRVGLVARDN